MRMTLFRSARNGNMATFFLGLVGVVVFLGVLFFLARSTRPADTGIVLYYGIGCPHCAKVEAFLKENKVEDKMEFTRKEVYQDQKNAYAMGQHAGKCGMPKDNIAVPFLWTGSKCLIGDVEIIAFFQSALTQLAGSSRSSSK